MSKDSRAHDEFRELVRHLRIDPPVKKIRDVVSDEDDDEDDSVLDVSEGHDDKAEEKDSENDKSTAKGERLYVVYFSRAGI